MFFESPFQSLSPVPDGTQIIFVSDLFVEDYVGGAELTTDALVKSSPYKVAQVKAKDVTMEMLEKHVKLFWVFGNFSQLNPYLIPSIAANIRYAVVEYDYKYCKFRSPEKHADAEKRPCDCHDQVNGKLVSAFYYGAETLFWMSAAQKDRYHKLFPFLAEKNNIVLSSVFDNKTLDRLTMPRPAITRDPKWIVLGSNSWVKGFDAAQQWCFDNNVPHEIVWNVPYDDVLKKLRNSEGFVYLPQGADTCPRMVIEAKILGCELEINDNVQHAKEAWFDTRDIKSIVDYLRGRPKFFWDSLKRFVENKPTISGYTTTRNCVEQKYPFEQCIQSMLGFCDEVVVVDGGSTDDTFYTLIKLAYGDQSIVFDEDLKTMAELHKLTSESYEFPNEIFGVKRDPRVKVKIVWRDWSDDRFAVYDGLQKAEARKLCTGDFCWQMDSDEIVHEDHYDLIREFVQMFPKGVNLVALPVVEYWGGQDKVRIDVTPWKWRISRNLPGITHGIPGALRKVDENGDLFAAQGTDGCDMIDAETLEPIPHVSFYSNEANAARQAALAGNTDALYAYQEWFNNVVDRVPGVFHYSWYDLPRKIKTYQGYWGKHWKSLYDIAVEDTPDNNMMFDKKWADVSDDDINDLAARLKGIGGWVWHQKWRGQVTPHIQVKKSQPKVMEGFYKGTK